MIKNNYSLEVLVNNQPVKQFFKNSKCFIEGRKETQYTLKFKNNSYKRVLAIFSVDGIEVIRGKVAQQSDTGYIIDAFSSIEVKGYRIDNSNVASFKFSGNTQSYSNQVGGEFINPENGKSEYVKSTENNGVIGVRVFEEKVQDIKYNDQYKPYVYSNSLISGSIGSGCITGSLMGNISFMSISGCAPSSSRRNRQLYQSDLSYVGPMGWNSNTNIGSNVNINNYSSCDVSQLGKLEAVDRATISPDFDLGTQWGQKVEDKVKTSSFNKSESYVDIIIYYATKESLSEYGIDFSNTKQYFDWPSAFGEKKKFCKLPKGYKI